MQPAYHLTWPMAITPCFTPRCLSAPMLRHRFHPGGHYCDGKHIAGVE